MYAAHSVGRQWPYLTISPTITQIIWTLHIRIFLWRLLVSLIFHFLSNIFMLIKVVLQKLLSLFLFMLDILFFHISY